MKTPKKQSPKKPEKNNPIKLDRIINMLSYLSAEEKEQFLSELLSAIRDSRSKGDFSEIDNCIADWEDIAELNSIKGLKGRVWERFNSLKSSGLIH